jgi:hypothetical protein
MEKKASSSISCQCKSTISKEHLNEILSNTVNVALFKCKKCKTKLNLKKEDFKRNTQLDLDLELHKYLGHKEQNLASILEAKLDTIDEFVRNVKEVKIGEYSKKIYDHFYLLRNKIDIHRETVLEHVSQEEDREQTTKVIEEINRLSSNLIEQLDLTEIELSKKFMQEITSFINEVNIDEKRKHLYEMYRDTTFFKYMTKCMKNLLNEYETKMNQIQSGFAEIEDKFVTNLTFNQFKEFNQGIVRAFEGINFYFYEICLKNEIRLEGGGGG